MHPGGFGGGHGGDDDEYDSATQTDTEKMRTNVFSSVLSKP